MAVRKAGRVVASVAAVALLGVAVTACDSGDSDDGKGASRKVTESRGSEGRLESDSPSAGAASEGSASEGASPSASPEVVPEAKVPPVSASRLAKVPATVKGGVITVGKPSAKHTVKVYEDPRCPVCKKFEESGAQALVAPLSAGDVKVEYTIASFLDKNLGGSGSVNAANALRAAVESDKFPQFHSALFTNQPEESDDAFTPAFLLKIADTVGLRDGAFKKAVTNGTYKSWVGIAMESFEKDGMTGTPTVVVDGKKVASEALYVEGDFRKVLKDAGIS
ncbi:DsbA family protein [Streptomyces lasiicapitis]|nr:thioredoxin domain-containing protein [Streptomyces lasiicapitis]